MPRIAARVLMVCLLLFPAAAFADVYQLNGPPDISIQGMTVQGNTGYATLSGASSTGGATVGTLIDAPGTGCYSAPCSLGFVVPYAVMTADQNGFVIYDDYNPPGSATPGIFLTASLVAGSYVNEGSNGEVGELFKVTFDDVGFWNDVEISNAGPLNPHTVGATSLPVGTEGTEMVMDIHDAMDVEGAYADLTPYYGETPAATPEPASLTLFCTGLAAGLIRKRLARKKA